MSYTAFSQPWPSGPPAFAWPDDPAPAQFAIDPLTAMLLAGGVTAGGVALLRKLLGRRQSAEQGGRSRGAAPTKAAPQNKYPMRISARAVPPPRPFFPAKVPEETSHEYKTPYGRTQAYRDEEFRPHGLPRQQVQQQPYYGYGGLSQQPPVRRARNPHAAALSDDAPAQFSEPLQFYDPYLAGIVGAGAVGVTGLVIRQLMKRYRQMDKRYQREDDDEPRPKRKIQLNTRYSPPPRPKDKEKPRGGGGTPQ